MPRARFTVSFQILAQFVKAYGGAVDKSVTDNMDQISRLGAAPLLVANRARTLGIILLPVKLLNEAQAEPQREFVRRSA